MIGSSVWNSPSLARKYFWKNSQNSLEIIIHRSLIKFDCRRFNFTLHRSTKKKVIPVCFLTILYEKYDSLNPPCPSLAYVSCVRASLESFRRDQRIPGIEGSLFSYRMVKRQNGIKFSFREPLILFVSSDGLRLLNSEASIYTFIISKKRVEIDFIPQMDYKIIHFCDYLCELEFEETRVWATLPCI